MNGHAGMLGTLMSLLVAEKIGVTIPQVARKEGDEHPTTQGQESSQ